jgi:hypothetical protein
MIACFSGSLAALGLGDGVGVGLGGIVVGASGVFGNSDDDANGVGAGVDDDDGVGVVVGGESLDGGGGGVMRGPPTSLGSILEKPPPPGDPKSGIRPPFASLMLRSSTARSASILSKRILACWSCVNSEASFSLSAFFKASIIAAVIAACFAFSRSAEDNRSARCGIFASSVSGRRCKIALGRSLRAAACGPIARIVKVWPMGDKVIRAG